MSSMVNQELHAPSNGAQILFLKHQTAQWATSSIWVHSNFKCHLFSANCQISISSSFSPLNSKQLRLLNSSFPKLQGANSHGPLDVS